MNIRVDWAMNYETVADSLRRNGDRHAVRAILHMNAGRPDYAEGSMRKARRNWERAKQLQVPVFTAAFAEALERNVAAVLLGR